MKIWLNEIHNDIIDEAETKWLQLLYHLYGVLEDRGTDRSTDSPPPPSFSKKNIERGTTSVTVIKEMWFMVEGMWYCQCAGIQDTTNLFSDSISSNETRSNILQCKEITCVPVIKSIVMDINGTWLFGRLSIMFHEMDTKFVFTNRVAYI